MLPSSGFFIQGAFGANGNFEIVVPSAKGGLVHCFRNHDAAGFPWTRTATFASGYLDGVSLIQRFDGAVPGDLELVARSGDRLAYIRRDDGKWKEPAYLFSNIAGRPAFLQSRTGIRGNYEVVVSVDGGRLAHYRRQDDDPARPWTSPVFFAEGLGEIEGVALLQSSLGVPGNFELAAVVRAGDERSLVHYWCDPSEGIVWHGPAGIPLPGAQPRGVPSLVENKSGDFDLIVPTTGGAIAHLTRHNEDFSWTAPRFFGEKLTDASLAFSVFGNLEAVALSGNRFQHYWFEEPAATWHGPTADAYADPAPDLPVAGDWRVPYSCSVVGIHAALLRTGKVLFFTYRAAEDQGSGVSCVFDPETGAEIELTDLTKDPFCGGHSFLPDGRLLSAGGSGAGLRALYLFDPIAPAWQELPDLPAERWYPTCTTLPDGRVFILSGTRDGGTQPGAALNDTWQIFSSGAGLSEPVQMEFLNEIAPVSIYPFVFVLPDGRLFLHGWNKTAFFDLATQRVEPTRILSVRGEPRNYPVQGAGVLLPLLPDADPPYRARVMLIGGGGVPPTTTMPATETCEILDLSAEAPAWRSAAPLSSPRVMPDAVLLPDSTVLVVNGSAAGWAHDANTPVYGAQIYHPGSDLWSHVCPTRVPRLYHSTALLLPDGRVLTAGTDETYNIEPFHRSEYRLELFSPPYLFRGPRPVISAAPEEIHYAENFTVATPDAASIASAALLRPGAVTHSLNMDQRHVGLRIPARASTQLTLEAPPGASIAPPGYYMLFLLNTLGVPSVARFVRL